MKFLPIVALFLGLASASETEDENYTNSLDDCLAFASQFDNTCASQQETVAFSQVPTKLMTCTLSGSYCPRHGSMGSDNVCTFTRKLCVTCRQVGDKVKIRTQSDGMSNHCLNTPNQGIAQVEVDYESNWLSPVEPYSGESLSQDDLNEQMCNIFRSRNTNIPSSAEFVQTGSQAFNTGWGIAVSGVMIFNAISGEGVDPFYPARYGRVTNPDSVIERVDNCLAHPQPDGLFHYHTVSTCVADPTIDFKARDRTDILTKIRNAYNSLPYRSVFGLSKDGRPIYTPHYGNMQDYNDCEVDVCNGITIGGHYSYVATYFHPYVMGCYGPGDSPNLSQQCSSNPRSCNVPVSLQSNDNGSSALTASIVAVGLFAIQAMI